MTEIGISLTEEKEHELVNQLIKNVELFACVPYEMLMIDTKMVSHNLSIQLFTKSVV